MLTFQIESIASDLIGLRAFDIYHIQSRKSLTFPSMYIFMYDIYMTFYSPIAELAHFLSSITTIIPPVIPPTTLRLYNIIAAICMND